MTKRGQRERERERKREKERERERESSEADERKKKKEEEKSVTSTTSERSSIEFEGKITTLTTWCQKKAGMKSISPARSSQSHPSTSPKRGKRTWSGESRST